MGDELKILGVVTEDIYEGVGIASEEPTSVHQGSTFTLTNAGVASSLPSSDDGFTVNYGDGFASITPVPAGLTYVPGSIHSRAVTQGRPPGGHGHLLHLGGTGCDANMTGNYKTDLPLHRGRAARLDPRHRRPERHMPTVTAQFTATGSVGHAGPST